MEKEREASVRCQFSTTDSTSAPVHFSSSSSPSSPYSITAATVIVVPAAASAVDLCVNAISILYVRAPRYALVSVTSTLQSLEQESEREREGEQIHRLMRLPSGATM